MKVRYMLEYMSICGDPVLFADIKEEEGLYPAPSGVPTGITIMPDFVIDIHAELLEKDPEGPIPPAAVQAIDVGSRAGRMAWILHALGGQDDGLCTVNYVTRTGHLGREVLENRFQRRPGRTMTQPMPLRHVFRVDEDDWVAVYDPRGSSSRPEPRVAESDSVKLDLSADDLAASPHSLDHVFADTRYIVVASKYARRVRKAFKVIEAGLEHVAPRAQKLRDFLGGLEQLAPTGPPIGILLDISALANGEDGPQAAGELLALADRLGNLHAVHSTLLCSEAQLEEVAGSLSGLSNVIVRGSGTTRLLQGGDSISVGPGLDLSGLMAREAFTAGYVLATTCDLAWQGLQQWRQYFHKLRAVSDEKHSAPPSSGLVPPESPPGPGGLLPGLGASAVALRPEERLGTAVVGAMATATKGYPLTYYELLQAIPQADTLPAIDCAGSWQEKPADAAEHDQELECARAMTRGMSYDEGQNLLRDLQDMGDVASRNSVPRFDATPARAEQSLHVPTDGPLHLIASARARDISRGRDRMRRQFSRPNSDIRRAVMIDLDGTLIDSSRLRQTCWFSGLRAFFGIHDVRRRATGRRGRTSPEDILAAVELYEALVYRQSEEFEWVLESGNSALQRDRGDFRQVWDHAYAWAALLWILGDGDTNLNTETLRPERWRRILREYRAQGRHSPICLKLTRRLFDRKVGSRAALSAMRDLRDYVLHFAMPLRAAADAFWAVDAPPHPQARSCIEALRAMEDCEVYVATEGHEATQLHKLRCTGLDDLLPGHRLLSTGAASSPDDVRDDLEDLRSRDTWDLSQEQEQVVDLFITMLEVLSSKGHYSFYAASIDAIRRDPTAPAHVLGHFGDVDTLGVKADVPPSMQFYMVGDRYDNDCRTLIRMFPPPGLDGVPAVGTCRVLAGKYADRFYPPGPDEPSTTYVCDTLAQCAHLLTSDSAWSDIGEIEGVGPPLLVRELDGEIACERASADGRDIPLSEVFEDLARAWGDGALCSQRSIASILRQISRDVSGCSTPAQERLFRDVAPQVNRWCRQQDETLYRGALSGLHALNRQLGNLLGSDVYKRAGAIQGLTAVLCSHLLAWLGVPEIHVRGEDIKLSPDDGPPVNSADAIVEALPYSQASCAVVEALLAHPSAAAVLGDALRAWLTPPMSPGDPR